MKNYQHLNLDQKLVKVRKKIPSLIRKRYSEDVDYDFLKMEDINEFLTPALDRYGVNFDIVEESSTLADKETGRAAFLVEANGLWRYEANLVLRWTNADRPEETKDVFLHAIGTHETADKAKGTAWTYCIKYYLMHKFNIRQAGFEDPDMVGQKDAPLGQENSGESREKRPAVPGSSKTPDPSLKAVLEKSKQAAARLAEEDAALENGPGKRNPSAVPKTEGGVSAKAVKKSQASTAKSAPLKEGKRTEDKKAGKTENPEEVKAETGAKKNPDEEAKGMGEKTKAGIPQKAMETDGFTLADEEEIPFEEETGVTEKSEDDYFADDDFFTEEEEAVSKKKEDSPEAEDGFPMEEEATGTAADVELEAARNYPCNYGIYMGMTLGEMLDSGDNGKKGLRWLATSYKGGNTKMKKAARLLLGMEDEEAETGIAA